MSAEAISVNCSTDPTGSSPGAQATLSSDAAGNPVWLLDGPQSILGGEQLDFACTVFYPIVDNVGAPFLLNVSLEGRDHCYTYIEPPTFGPGPTAGLTGTFAPESTAGPTGTFAPESTAGPTGTFAPESTASPTGTFAPEPTTTFVDQPIYCCGSWGSYLTEDDQNAGKATSVLSVIACTNYTDGVEIALR